MTRALVTGASGFIGGHLVQHLYEYGHEITCLVRPSSNRSRLEPYRPQFKIGDVTDVESLKAAVKDVDVVYHLAGTTKCLRIEEFEHINIEGVRNVVQACAKCTTPPVLILVSSLAAAGPMLGDRLRVESDPPMPVSNYGRSKLAGEYAALQYVHQVPITIIRPPIVLGEADRDGLTMFDSIARWNLHLVAGMSDELFSVIHGDDLAEALILAARRGHRLKDASSTDGIYFATADETPTYAELGRMIGEAIGRDHVHVVHNPKPAVWCIAAINEFASQLRGRPHILGVDKAREATAGSWACDDSALRRDTGYAPAFSLQQRLAQTAHWYTRQGWLKPVEQPLLVH
ncbi:MAG: NAD-dependent epimerase/dehydratase family protein [Planctomycetales bacterium]|nr:NAD-dependent epimerase/dehydratase family protein [Planctomycetales bacterium]